MRNIDLETIIGLTQIDINPTRSMLAIRRLCEGRLARVSQSAADAIDAERERQDAKLGEQDHDPQVWMAILGEEYGELCQAANNLRWPKGAPDADPFRHALVEAIQTAAVAKAIVECLLRSTWKWPRKPSAYDQTKRYVIASDDEPKRRYVQMPLVESFKCRLLVLSETVTDDTLIGSGDECEGMISVLSGVCGTSGLQVVEVPHD